jgi:type II secretory pathway component GspD/PulD (secretin)
LYSQ